MTADEVVTRATSAVGKGTAYRLGASTVGKECDCSGFVAWAFGVPRKVDLPMYVHWNGGWFETSAIYRDALSPYGFFRQLQWAESQPGDVLVYADSHGRQGHIGIVSVTDAGVVKVIHCSKGNWRQTDDAIRETGPEVFVGGAAIAARWHEFDNPEEIA